MVGVVEAVGVGVGGLVSGVGGEEAAQGGAVGAFVEVDEVGVQVLPLASEGEGEGGVGAEGGMGEGLVVEGDDVGAVVVVADVGGGGVFEGGAEVEGVGGAKECLVGPD